MNENRCVEGLGSSRSTAILFSEDFFDQDVFRDTQGIDPIYPITRIYNHIRATGDSTFTSQQLASSIRLTEPKTRSMMIVLAHKGYLEMNLRTARPPPRTSCSLTWRMRPVAGITMCSFSGPRRGGHTEISLLNRLLKLDGVSRVDVSRDRGVVIEPKMVGC